jgi:integrase
MPSSLSAPEVARLCRPGVHRVDRRLYLQIAPSAVEGQPFGPRSWVFRYMLRGKPRTMGLGPYPAVSLQRAFNRAVTAYNKVLDGVDPIETQRAERVAARTVSGPVAHTFTACAVSYVEAHRSAWSNPKHLEQWERTLATYAGPIIGHLAVDAIKVDHMVQILEPIWTTKSETAGRLRGRIEKVLGWAEAKGYRSGANPASWRGPLGHRLPALSKVRKTEHYDAVPHAEVPALARAIAARSGTAAVALAFTLFTAARSGEVRGMTWGEIDRKAKVWIVPPERMKAREEHRVPLTDDALALLPAKTGPAGALVFPGTKPGKPLSDMTLLKSIRALRGSDATVHGLRASFSTWAAEATDYPREVVEAALAHKIANPVEAAYKRTSFFDKRRELMQSWADHVAGRRASDKAEMADAA